MKVEGEIRIGEANPAAAAVQQRAHGTQWGGAVAFVFTLVGMVIGGVLGQSNHLPEGVYSGRWVLGAIMGLSLGHLIGRRVWMAVALWQARRRYADRGTPDPMPVSLEITPDALVYVVAGVTRIIQWPAVTDLFRAGEWWVFIGQGDPCFLHRRFFVSGEEKRAFVAAALERMSEPARARSADVVRWSARSADLSA